MTSARHPSVVSDASLEAADRAFMERALRIARRGQGRVEPNPMVGCVLVRGERIIGEGYHRRFGGPHAEVEALRACRGSPRGATVYVTLEPCRHFGKTPPCTEALIQAGVSRVVAAHVDPNPVINGEGFRRLREAGICVTEGVLRERAAELLAPYLTGVRFGRPYVLVKWAQSLDGKAATRSGESRWISGEAARRCVHRLRARVDAILVGVNTVLADDPRLTARGVRLRRRASRVVLDSRLRLPPTSRLARTAREAPVWVLTSSAAAASPKAGRLRSVGVEVLAAPTRGGFINLKRGLRLLRERGVANLLVEGGPTVLTSFFEAGYVDEAWVFVAPKLIGGIDAPSPLQGRGVTRIVDAIRPPSGSIRRIGEDVLHRLRFAQGLSGDAR